MYTKSQIIYRVETTDNGETIKRPFAVVNAPLSTKTGMLHKLNCRSNELGYDNVSFTISEGIPTVDIDGRNNTDKMLPSIESDDDLEDLMCKCAKPVKCHMVVFKNNALIFEHINDRAEPLPEDINTKCPVIPLGNDRYAVYAESNTDVEEIICFYCKKKVTVPKSM